MKLVLWGFNEKLILLLTNYQKGSVTNDHIMHETLYTYTWRTQSDLVADKWSNHAWGLVHLHPKDLIRSRAPLRGNTWLMKVAVLASLQSSASIDSFVVGLYLCSVLPRPALPRRFLRAEVLKSILQSLDFCVSGCPSWSALLREALSFFFLSVLLLCCCKGSLWVTRSET